MSHVLFLVGGVVLGVAFEKSIRAWKGKIERAAHAAQRAMQD